MKIFQKSQNVKVRISRNRRSGNSLERLPISRIFRLFKLTFAYAKSVISVQHFFYRIWSRVWTRDDCSGILSGKCLTHFSITVWFIVKSFQDYEVKVRTEDLKTGFGLRHSTVDLKKSTFAVFKVINQNHPRLSNRSNGTAMGTPKPGWSNRNFDTYHPWPINRNRVTLDSSDWGNFNSSHRVWK